MILTQTPCLDGREKPTIDSDIDQPFPETKLSSAVDNNVKSVRLKERDQEHNHKVEDYKNVVGGILLAICFLVIIIFSVLDAAYKIESTLFSGAVEFSKTIATAVIGYLFGTNMKSN